MKKICLLLMLIFVLFGTISYAEECNIFLFYSKTCPHCTKEDVFLKQLENKYPKLTIQYVDVAQDHELFKQMSEKHDTIPVGVPRTFINGTVLQVRLNICKVIKPSMAIKTK